MKLTDKQQKEAAKKFSEYWAGKGYEKGESQKFWIDLLVNVFGVQNIAEFISFEDQVHLDHTSFIDVYIPSICTMKSLCRRSSARHIRRMMSRL